MPLLDCLRRRYIRRNGEHSRAGFFFDLFSRGGDGVGVARSDRNLRALFGERARDRISQAPARARNHRHFVRQSQIHKSYSLSKK